MLTNRYSGAFAEVNWRWILYINFPFIVIGSALIMLFLHLNGQMSSLRAKLQRVDWLGAFIFVASTTSLLIPLTWGGIMYDWDSWRTLVPLLLGATGLGLFIFYEIRFAAEPLVRLSLFRIPTMVLSYAGTFLHGLVLWTMLYYAPLFIEGVKGQSAVVSGIWLFPMTFTVAPMSVIAGLVVTKTGHYREILWTGWSFATLGLGLMCIIKAETTVISWIFITLVPGIGLGLLFTSLRFSVQAAAPPVDLTFAVALFAFFRGFGQSLGVAMGGLIFQNQMFKNLLTYPELANHAHEYSRDAASLILILKALPAGEMKHDLAKAYTDSLRVVWGVCAAFAGIAFIMSFWVKHYTLDVALQTEQGFMHEKRRAEVEDGVVSTVKSSDSSTNA